MKLKLAEILFSILALVFVVGMIAPSAQAQEKPKSLIDSTPRPATIPIAEPEAAQLKSMIEEANKIQAEYVDAIQKAEAAKELRMSPLRSKWNTLLVQAGAKSGLGLAELATMDPKIEKDTVVWVKREPPKTETPAKVN